MLKRSCRSVMGLPAQRDLWRGVSELFGKYAIKTQQVTTNFFSLSLSLLIKYISIYFCSFLILYAFARVSKKFILIEPILLLFFLVPKPNQAAKPGR